MSERAAPFYCPYCGDEDLRPCAEGGHGAWECGACRRAFQLKFLGLLAPAGTPDTATTTDTATSGGTGHERHG
ncbi:hypothetical protein [Kitasatospora sp. NPDC050543]|uniref:hypothetical protein n=1 Tax=Kitasatospora sp. NPDC050543 TaxID=3364054 RepID=UPI00378BC04B